MRPEQPSLFDVLPDEPPPPPLAPDQPARDRIATDLATTLFVEAGAGAGKTTALVGRILGLVAAEVPIDAIAAITFTEKAAGELRHRLRERLLAAPQTAATSAALDGLDHAPIGTLHAFARRLLFEFPVEAGLPPGFTVLDELESQLAFDERWEDLLDSVLDDAEREVAPDLRAAELVQLLGWRKFGVTRGLRQVTTDFQANWDLVEQRVELAAPSRPTISPAALVTRARAIAATPTPIDDRQGERVALVGQLADEVESAGDLGVRLAALDELGRVARGSIKAGNKNNWKGRLDDLEAVRAEHGVLADEVDAHLTQWQRYRERIVGAICGRFVLDGAEARAAAGTLEFHDLLVLARRLLATDGGARRRLHERYRRVLLDEFQDTDPIQLEIAVRLTADPDGQPTDGIDGVVPLPGRLFVVGDPKQSIYRFRRADIATYLRAAAQVDATGAVLSANFRSTDHVIDWVNGVFGVVIEPQHDVQPVFLPLDAARPGRRDHGSVHVLGGAEHADDDVDAETLRRREAASVAAAVATALRDGWPVGDGAGGLRPCRAGDIAILLPARTSLPMLEPALAELAVPYRAENASVVYLAPEIRDTMLALRAVADPTDELALVAALRSPLYGCSDVELLEWRTAGGRFRLHGAVPEALVDHGVAEAIGHLESIARDVGRVTPADLLDRVVVERRLLEGALGGADAAGCVAPGPLRRRPGPGVDRRRGQGPAPLPAVGRVPGPRGSGQRHHPPRARSRRGADHDRARIEGSRVPDHDRQRHDHRGAATQWCVRRVAAGRVGAGREGQRAVRGVQAHRRADGRRRAAAAAVRRVHPGRRPPGRVAAPQAARPESRRRHPAELEPARRVRRRRARCRGAGRARCRHRAGAGRAARAAVARCRCVGRRAGSGDGRRASAVGDERHRAGGRAGRTG